MLNYDIGSINNSKNDDEIKLLAIKKNKEPVFAKINKTKIADLNSNNFQKPIETNISLYDALPIGSVMMFWNCEDRNGNSRIPNGWVRLEGQKYSDLGIKEDEIAILKKAIGAKDSENNLPDQCSEKDEPRKCVGVYSGKERDEESNSLIVKESNIPFHGHTMRDYYYTIDAIDNDNDKRIWAIGSSKGIRERVGNDEINLLGWSSKPVGNGYQAHFKKRQILLSDINDCAGADTGAVEFDYNSYKCAWNNNIYWRQIPYPKENSGKKDGALDKDNNAFICARNRTDFDCVKINDDKFVEYYNVKPAKDNMGGVVDYEVLKHAARAVPVDPNEIDKLHTKVVVNLIIKIKDSVNI